MIYFDNSATTKPSETAITAARAAMEINWGNPSSVHFMGNEAARLLSSSRDAVAAAIGVRHATGGRVVFTSGGTEADNMALLGITYAKDRPVNNGSRGVIMISDGEHAAIENSAEALEKDGFTVLRVPTIGGVLDIDYIKTHATKNVILASFMLVNNETGAVYDVRSAADAVRAASPNAVIHSDCVQALGKIRFSPTSLKVDALTVSAHKIGALKGTGALWISDRIIKTKRISPIVFGGGQEENRRSGTENTVGIAAFAAACREAVAEFDARAEKVTALREYADAALKNIDGITINRPSGAYLPHIISITLPKIKSETMLNHLSSKGICISAGSACSARSRHISRALAAFGVSLADADSTVRVSMDHDNTDADIDALVSALKDGISGLQRIR